jgi:hypothetical protein
MRIRRERTGQVAMQTLLALGAFASFASWFAANPPPWKPLAAVFKWMLEMV